jgi:O-antigen/teichoic acid export membrane protein
MQKVLSAGFASVALVSLLLALLGILLSGYVASVFGGTIGVTQNLLELGSLILFSTIMYGAVAGILIGLGRGRDFSVAYLAYMASDLAITSYTLLNGYGIVGILLGSLIGSVIGLVVALFYINRYLSQYMDFCPWYPKAPDVKRALGFSYPLAIYNFFTNSMQNFSIILLGFFVSETVIGNYGTALKGLSVLLVFYGSVVSVMLPTFSEAAKKSVKRAYSEGVFNASVLYSVFVTFPILLFFAIFSKSLIYILIGSSYTLAPYYLTLIAIGTVTGLVGFFSGSMLIARGFTKKILKYGGLSSLLQFVSMLLLVPYFGVIGAIVGIFFIGSVANSIFFTFAVSRMLKIRVNLAKLSRLSLANIGAALLMVIALFAAQSMAIEIIAGLAILIIAYPAFVVISRAMDSKEIEYFRSSTSSLAVAGPIIGAVCDYMAAVDERVG